MSKVYFLFGVHNHQPVGNFDFVFEEAYQKAYRPFLEVVARYPWFRFALHNSGCLWEWLVEHHPEYLDIVRGLVDAGQVELWGGGFYEPILPAIPEADRQGQLRMMSDFLQDRFGIRPRGAWVAERVWEPCLAGVLAQAGIEFTVLDDAHFKAAGLAEDKLKGFYLTEDQGSAVKVFPISQRLRYLIPFHDVDEVIGHLLNDHQPGDLAILADDGEKFGVWPGTHDHVYRNLWLEKFLEKLSPHQDSIQMVHFSQTAAAGARGRIYLPGGSYTEMGEWVLEPEAEAVYRELVERLKQEGSYQRYAPFIRGGIWKNFFAKYPEANFLYRKMLEVSAKAAAAGPEARKELYRGQCNCGYWHGIFGGLYLPHLRSALYQHLIKAENLSAPKTISGVIHSGRDCDGDGQEEILIANSSMNLYLKPQWGGAVYEWDLKDREVNILDNFSRRPESYHRRIREHRASGESGKSIHEMMLAKEEGLENLLAYDPCPRMALVDHLLRPEVGWEALANATAEAYQGVFQIPWSLRQEATAEGLALAFTGRCQEMEIIKILEFTPRRTLSLSYRWVNRSGNTVSLRPGVEFNFGLLSAGEGRYCSSPQTLGTRRLDQGSRDAGIRQLTLHDDHRRIEITFSLSQPWELWRYPVETVSQSESGLERNYQCSCLVWTKMLNLAPGESASLEMRLEVKT